MTVGFSMNKINFTWQEFVVLSVSVGPTAVCGLRHRHHCCLSNFLPNVLSLLKHCITVLLAVTTSVRDFGLSPLSPNVDLRPLAFVRTVVSYGAGNSSFLIGARGPSHEDAGSSGS